MKSPTLTYWKQHKLLLLSLLTLIVFSFIIGLDHWQSLVFTALFIGVILFKQSRFNPEFVALKKQLEEKK